LSLKEVLYKESRRGSLKMADEQNQKRQIAQKVRIKEILQGTYVQEEGWMPNNIESNGRKISRVNIIGVVVAKEGGNRIIIEDGTGKISARFFEDEGSKLSNVDIGNVVLVIGRPREYGNERYILLEIIKKIQDKRWIEVRNLELKDVKIENDEVVEKVEEPVSVNEDFVEEESIGEERIHDKVIKYIKDHDNGEGVDYEEVLSFCDDEKTIKFLLSEGELFEIRPGRVKVLE